MRLIRTLTLWPVAGFDPWRLASGPLSLDALREHPKHAQARDDDENAFAIGGCIVDVTSGLVVGGVQLASRRHLYGWAAVPAAAPSSNTCEAVHLVVAPQWRDGSVTACLLRWLVRTAAALHYDDIVATLASPLLVATRRLGLPVLPLGEVPSGSAAVRAHLAIAEAIESLKVHEPSVGTGGSAFFLADAIDTVFDADTICI